MSDQPAVRAGVPLPRRYRIAALAAPVIAAAIAVGQVALATTTELSPWRGGGFGMFSTIDAHHQRFVRLTATTASGEAVPLDPATFTSVPLLDERERAVRANPTEANFAALHRRIAATRWVSRDGVGLPAAAASTHGSGPASALFIDEVHLKVYRLEFAQDTGRLTPIELAVFTSRPAT